MKKRLESFFEATFDELLKKRGKFTLQESLSLQPELDIRAMAYFNLVLDGYEETDDGYEETLRDEINYLSGQWI